MLNEDPLLMVPIPRILLCCYLHKSQTLHSLSLIMQIFLYHQSCAWNTHFKVPQIFLITFQALQKRLVLYGF